MLTIVNVKTAGRYTRFFINVDDNKSREGTAITTRFLLGPSTVACLNRRPQEAAPVSSLDYGSKRIPRACIDKHANPPPVSRFEFLATHRYSSEDGETIVLGMAVVVVLVVSNGTEVCY